MSKKTALHIYLSPFENESRILRQTKALIDNAIIDSLVVVGYWKEGLAEHEEFGYSRCVYRIKINFLEKISPSKPFVKITKILKAIFILAQIFIKVRIERPTFLNLHQVLLLPFIPVFRLISPKSILIYDTHELETETNDLPVLNKFILKFFERLFINYFKHIFVVSFSIESWYRKKYNITNITTVMNCPEYQQLDKKNKFRENLNISPDSIIYLYQGALFKGRGIENLLDAFKKINNPKYSIVFMGYGEFQKIIELASTEFSNIFFHEAVSPDIVLNYTASADFGLTLIEDVCLSYHYCLPNKVFEYLMAGLPSIVSNIPELKYFVNINMVGVVCDTNTPDDIIDSVIKISNHNQNEFKDKISLAQIRYNWSIESNKMIEVYRSLI
jgi:glycosyltransferase involved in cell wall biosynthesis